MKIKVILLLLFSILLKNVSLGQGVYDDFVYTRQAVTERKVVAWPYLREADVMYAKRIWRIIDMREKQNQPMMWPKNPLNMIFYNNIVNGKLIAYKDDSLSTVVTPEEYIKFFAYPKINTKLIDPNGDPEDPSNVTYDTIQITLKSLDVKKLKVMEDWLFDKKESKMFVRIIAIAPIVRPQTEGAELGEVEWGWLRYHRSPAHPDKYDVREILVNMEVFNRPNDATRLTYDDWFEQRLFSSYIVKEQNQYDNYIVNFAEFKDNTLAAYLESERIKNDLFEKEHDLWEY